MTLQEKAQEKIAKDLEEYKIEMISACLIHRKNIEDRYFKDIERNEKAIKELEELDAIPEKCGRSSVLTSTNGNI